jgi:hypothetical protein
MKKFDEIKKYLKIAVVIGIVAGFILPGPVITAHLVNKNTLDDLGQIFLPDLKPIDDRTSDLNTITKENEIIITYKMHDLIQTQITNEHGIFTLLNIPDSGLTGEPGKPQLPYINLMYAVPTTPVSLEILEAHTAKSHPIGRLYPAQQPNIDGYTGEDAQFIIDENFYELDITYPTNIVEINQEGKIRDIPFIKIRFNPVQYNPKKEIATLYDEITIKISWTECEPLIVEHNFKQTPFYTFYENVFINWHDFSENTIVVESEPDLGWGAKAGCEYLIITHPTFATAAQELADWKYNKGILTRVKSTAKTGDTAKDIRQYIQAAYDTWDSKPSYILLVGDAEHVPTNYLYEHPNDGSNTASDLWYATVDGSDYYPDIFIGRISVDTIDQADTIVQKILTYEKTPPTLSDFYENFAVAAYFQDDEPNGYETRRFVRTSEEIRDYLLSEGYNGERIYYTEPYINPTHYNNGIYGNGEPLPPELLRPTFAWDGDHVDISNAINQGLLILNHRDHGFTHGWGDPYYDIDHIANLVNGELLPIVFSINCGTGRFDTEDGESFCEEFTRKNNGGSIGAFGATRVSYSGYNDFLCRGFYDAIWPDFDTAIGGNTPLYTMGQVLNYGKSYMADTWSDPGDYERVTFEMFHWFGDPTMEIWTDVPQTMVVDHPSEINDSDAVTVTVHDSFENPIGGALVCISHDRRYGTGLTDSNGVANFELTSPISMPTSIIEEEASLVVTAHDYLPYETTISIILELLGDINGDGTVNINDLILLLMSWGKNPDDPADLDGNGVINLRDLLILLMNWG